MDHSKRLMVLHEINGQHTEFWDSVSLLESTRSLPALQQDSKQGKVDGLNTNIFPQDFCGWGCRGSFSLWLSHCRSLANSICCKDTQIQCIPSWFGHAPSLASTAYFLVSVKLSSQQLKWSCGCFALFQPSLMDFLLWGPLPRCKSAQTPSDFDPSTTSFLGLGLWLSLCNIQHWAHQQGSTNNKYQ